MYGFARILAQYQFDNNDKRFIHALLDYAGCSSPSQIDTDLAIAGYDKLERLEIISSYKSFTPDQLFDEDPQHLTKTFAWFQLIIQRNLIENKAWLAKLTTDNLSHLATIQNPAFPKAATYKLVAILASKNKSLLKKQLTHLEGLLAADLLHLSSNQKIYVLPENAPSTQADMLRSLCSPLLLDKLEIVSASHLEAFLKICYVDLKTADFAGTLILGQESLEAFFSKVSAPFQRQVLSGSLERILPLEEAVQKFGERILAYAPKVANDLCIPCPQISTQKSSAKLKVFALGSVIAFGGLLFANPKGAIDQLNTALHTFTRKL